MWIGHRERRPDGVQFARAHVALRADTEHFAEHRPQRAFADTADFAQIRELQRGGFA